MLLKCGILPSSDPPLEGSIASWADQVWDPPAQLPTQDGRVSRPAGTILISLPARIPSSNVVPTWVDIVQDGAYQFPATVSRYQVRISHAYERCVATGPRALITIRHQSGNQVTISCQLIVHPT
jgi:hypothetical protein